MYCFAKQCVSEFSGIWFQSGSNGFSIWTSGSNLFAIQEFLYMVSSVLKTLLLCWRRLKQEVAINHTCSWKRQSFSNMRYNSYELNRHTFKLYRWPITLPIVHKWSIGSNYLTHFISSTHWLIVGTSQCRPRDTSVVFIFLWPSSWYTQWFRIGVNS